MCGGRGGGDGLPGVESAGYRRSDRPVPGETHRHSGPLAHDAIDSDSHCATYPNPRADGHTFSGPNRHTHPDPCSDSDLGSEPDGPASNVYP